MHSSTAASLAELPPFPLGFVQLASFLVLSRSVANGGLTPATTVLMARFVLPLPAPISALEISSSRSSRACGTPVLPEGLPHAFLWDTAQGTAGNANELQGRQTI